MDNKINLSQLAERLAQDGGISKAASEQFVKNFFDIITQNVISDGLVKVKGLGTFKLVQMEDRESVNVNTGERFTIEGHQKISFIPDPDLKERLNKPFAAFDTVEITAEQAKELAAMDKKPVESFKPQSVVPKHDTSSSKAEKGDHEEKEIYQDKLSRFAIKFVICFLSILLTLSMTAFLLWPIFGSRILEKMDIKLNGKDYIEIIRNDAPGIVDTPVVDEVVSEPTPQPTLESVLNTHEVMIAHEVEAVHEADTVHEVETTMPDVFRLTPEDQAKDLSEFTSADVVNYLIDGELTTHVLKKDETLTVLAQRYLGSKKLWPYIAKYNDINDPVSLRPGTKIKIPVLKNK